MPPVGFEPKISAGERPVATRLLRSWVRFPPGVWIFVCCECRVLSGRGLCDELITRPEESYRLCCVVVCDLETSRMGAPYIYDISRLRVNNSLVFNFSDIWAAALCFCWIYTNCPRKIWYPFTKIHGVTFRKTAMLQLSPCEPYISYFIFYLLLHNTFSR